jgi:hypothetical protein
MVVRKKDNIGVVTHSAAVRGRMCFSCSGCAKSLLPPLAAKFYIETAVGSLILLSKNNEPTAV